MCLPHSGGCTAPSPSGVVDDEDEVEAMHAFPSFGPDLERVGSLLPDRPERPGIDATTQEYRSRGFLL